MKYDFMGGEHHLRLVLGAHGFWTSRWHCGFSFYSPARQKYMHIKIYRYQQDIINNYVLIQLRVNLKTRVKDLLLLMNKTESRGNSEIWHVMTGTRLDLL